MRIPTQVILLLLLLPITYNIKKIIDYFHKK